MEGYNPAAGCTSGCSSCRTWVPFPKTQTRRDAYIDAVGRTDNPCDRPLRKGPCCEPTPKFRRPTEQPECNIDCYREEQQEAKKREAYEEYQKFVEHCCPPPPNPEMIIEGLNPDCPVQVQIQQEPQGFQKEIACRTNIIAGYFNPDDNKTPEQRLREQCDLTYVACGPCLPMYPCRAAITFPPIKWTTFEEERNKCGQVFCQGSKYCDPEYQREQMEEMRRKECEKKMEAQRLLWDEEYRKRYFSPNAVHPCCADQKLSLTPYCSCGCDYWGT